MFLCADRAHVSRNVVHRHEPPVTASPVKITLHDKERHFLVIDKPGSIVSRALPSPPTKYAD